MVFIIIGTLISQVWSISSYKRLSTLSTFTLIHVTKNIDSDILKCWMHSQCGTCHQTKSTFFNDCNLRLRPQKLKLKDKGFAGVIIRSTIDYSL